MPAFGRKYLIYTVNGARIPASKQECIKEACSLVETIIDLGDSLNKEARTERLIAVQKTLSGIIHTDYRGK